MSVTERDRQTAERISGQHRDWCQAHPEQNRPGWTCMCGIAERRDAIAEALADERERIRAPFLWLADDLDGEFEIHSFEAARLIREAAAQGEP